MTSAIIAFTICFCTACMSYFWFRAIKLREEIKLLPQGNADKMDAFTGMIKLKRKLFPSKSSYSFHLFESDISEIVAKVELLLEIVGEQE